MSKGKILVFAKAPVPGEVKTRLIPAIGSEQAAELHMRLVTQTLNTVCTQRPTPPHPVELWCTPNKQHIFFQSCAEKYSLTLQQQQGADLGERMLSALTTILKESTWAILIGTDCPNLNTDDIYQAIKALENGADAVIGPAHDGGYYLLGLKKTSPELFADIPWGSDEVWQLTQKKLRQLGYTYATLRHQHDLDRPEDLRRFTRASSGVAGRVAECINLRNV